MQQKMGVLAVERLNRRSVVSGMFAGALSSMLPGPILASSEPSSVAFADGGAAPRLGFGSWHMADGRYSPEQAQEAMRIGVSLGIKLIDTAEMYGDGRSEKLISQIIAGQRDKIFLVSKILPQHVTEENFDKALRGSLRRLGVSQLDLYLMHWRSRSARVFDFLHFRRGFDLRTAVNGFERARRQGLIKRWGVSNFSVSDMEVLLSIPGGENCATNQVLYNLASRSVERDLIPWCRRQKMPVMAYSPLGAGGTGQLLSHPTLVRLASARSVAPAAIALAWAMRDGQTITLMESGSSKHVREDAAAISISLSVSEIEALDMAFPPPTTG